MNRLIGSSLITCVTAAAFTIPLANAQTPYNASHDKLGFYVGANYGSAKSRGGEFDDDNEILEAMVGFKFNPYVGVEGTFTKFGEFEGVLGSASVDGYGVSAVGSWPMTDAFSVYGKAGMFFSTTDVNVAGFTDSFDDEHLFYGLGVDFAISDPLCIIVEYDRYEVEVDSSDWEDDFGSADVDIDVVKVGLKFKF